MHRAYSHSSMRVLQSPWEVAGCAVGATDNPWVLGPSIGLTSPSGIWEAEGQGQGMLLCPLFSVRDRLSCSSSMQAPGAALLGWPDPGPGPHLLPRKGKAHPYSTSLGCSHCRREQRGCCNKQGGSGWGDGQGEEGMGRRAGTQEGRECQGSTDRWKRQLRPKERRKRDLKGN